MIDEFPVPNYANALTSLSARHYIGYPEYSYRKIGDFFECTCTAQFLGPITSGGYKSKRQAKEAVSERMYHKIRQEYGPPPIDLSSKPTSCPF